jgi:ribonuclease T2
MARFKKPNVSPKSKKALFLAAVVALISGIAAEAQRGPWSGNSGQSGRQTKSYEPGKFDYYALALSWSPSYCANAQRGGRDDQQCFRRDGKKFAFVLHGLWPQFERGWPQDCKSSDNGFVPRPVANSMLDIMPSDKLVFHEYRKHGTCSGLTVDEYFGLSRKLHDAVKIPQRLQQVNDPRLTLSPDEVINDFIAINPGLKRDMLVVRCGGSGSRMEEVRVCFDKAGAFRSCGRNEDQRKACSAPRMFVPAQRST